MRRRSGRTRDIALFGVMTLVSSFMVADGELWGYLPARTRLATPDTAAFEGMRTDG